MSGPKPTRALETEHDGHLLAQVPYIETTPRYASFEGGFRDLKIPASSAEFLQSLADLGDDAPIFPTLYQHQAEALSAFLGRDSRNLVVATGTGSGKSETFMLPMLGTLHEEARSRPRQFAQRGVRALVLYPMNALVNDQLARLRKLLGDERVARHFRESTGAPRHPVFGMYTGRTPYAGPRSGSKDRERIAPLLEYYRDLPEDLARELRQRGRLPAKDLVAFLAEDKAGERTIQRGRRKGQKQQVGNWPLRLRTSPGDRELLTRHEMIFDPETGEGASPDVLITNYSMLEYMLMRPFERPLFDETKAWLAQPGSRFVLVIDEAHMYRGAKGAEVAYLIRRLFDRLGVTDHPDKVSAILTSASLGDRADSIENAARFAADLTGVEPSRFTVITGQRASPPGAARGHPRSPTRSRRSTSTGFTKRAARRSCGMSSRRASVWSGKALREERRGL